ncbi:hypothetical protein OPT61_g7486 [Boeremia exigua]|uniref:Uncharacterized protein n=1 Tax=Boeremia exigua TaxID=749465 RepID=A0ACC2I219_9PLEO|nr:hypothetical protein OPT61_g7486 [Boeremia exigua]
MPADRDLKPTSDSEKSHTSWWTKCLPTFPVRERRRSSDDPNRPVMTVADSPRKKRRALSPLANNRKPVPTIPIMEADAGDVEARIAKAELIFDGALEDVEGIKDYSTRHEQLLDAEDQQAWDRGARPDPESRSFRTEERAAAIVRAVRNYEREYVFGNMPSEAIPAKSTRDMGGQFLTNKKRINERSKLFEIANLVPKGALLHLHFNSELFPDQLMERAREMETMYIRSIRPLVKEEDLKETEIVFNVMDPAQVEEGVDIFSENYPGDATNWRTGPMKFKVWMKWIDFQERFKERFGKDYPSDHNDPASNQSQEQKDDEARCCGASPEVKLNSAEVWLKSKMVLSETEAYGPDQTVNGVWARFNQATRCFKGLLNYESVYKWYIGNAIERMIKEKVMYAELRPMLLDKSIPSDDGKRQISNAEQMKLILAAVEEKKEDLRKKKILHKFPFGLKIIYCTPRSIPKSTMQKEMKQCIELKLQFPDLICGFDLVGAEDRPNHIGYYKEELLAFQKACDETIVDGKKLEIPFLFHAGETLLDTGGSNDPKNSNLYDAALLKSKRIGHGFALMKHPHLVEKYYKRKIDEPGSGICVELCPISNELLHLCRNIKEHPYPELLAAGIPCTVNSDNPSLFSNTMPHEFYQIMVGAPTITLYSWKQLARWSIEYSCLSADEKKEGQKLLETSWIEFCQNVIHRYGKLMKDDHVTIDKEKADTEYKNMLKTNKGKPAKDKATYTTSALEEAALEESAGTQQASKA